HDAPGVLHGQGRLRADAIPLEGPVPALDLAVALRVVRRRAHVRHATDPDELLEVPGDELRPVVRDDPRRDAREPLAGPLPDLLDVHLGHRLPDLPVDEVSAAPVEQAAQVVERPADVEVRDVYVPMLVRPQRLDKPLTL